MRTRILLLVVLVVLPLASTEWDGDEEVQIHASSLSVPAEELYQDGIASLQQGDLEDAVAALQMAVEASGYQNLDWQRAKIDAATQLRKMAKVQTRGGGERFEVCPNLCFSVSKEEGGGGEGGENSSFFFQQRNEPLYIGYN